jgi:DNA-binding NarL/FixJ family response regulator
MTLAVRSHEIEAPTQALHPVPRALVLSESQFLRIGIRVLISKAGIARVAGEADSAHKLTAAVEAADVELVVAAPVDGGNEPLLRELDALPESCKVLILLPVPAFRIHSASLQADHDFACLPLDATAQSLDAVVRSAMHDDRGTLKVYDLCGGPLGTLTRREQEVLRQLARGLTNREIAEELVVSQDTVKAHLRHTYRKLGVGTRGGAIAMYIKQLGSA